MTTEIRIYHTYFYGFLWGLYGRFRVGHLRGGNLRCEVGRIRCFLRLFTGFTGNYGRRISRVLKIHKNATKKSKITKRNSKMIKNVFGDTPENPPPSIPEM